jgi:hypothetical protein
MEKIPGYGDLMTMDEFIGCVECGAFIDYDGFGRYATETEMEGSEFVKPSMVENKTIDRTYTHIVWFNR